MKAGDLKHRIELMQDDIAVGPTGQRVSSGRATIATVWAAKWQLSTKDVARQAGISEQAEAKFLIRHRTDITTRTKVVFNSKTYQVTGTEEFEDGIGLFLFVKETSSQ